MLDKDTMYYSVNNGKAKSSKACVLRATATGTFPNKKWTEGDKAVYCTNDDDRFNLGAPDIDHVQVFKCHLGRLWLAFGNDFSGIFLIGLNGDTGLADYNPAEWSSNTSVNPHWFLAKDIPSAKLKVSNPEHTGGKIKAPFVHYNW